MGQRVGIIGAGYAGISTARILKAFGFDVVVWEKEQDVGGVWSASRRYPGLTTQNPRDTYFLSEMPMPKSFPEWPDGYQVQAYMEDYARKFGILSDIKTGHEVLLARQDADGHWEISCKAQASSGASYKVRENVDYLIVCNGIFSIPFVPDFEGAAEFRSAGGQLLHTSQFVDRDSAAGKHVVVVGYGKSSCDVARAMLGVSGDTTIVVRNLIWKIPKKIGNVLNFKHLFLTRMGEALFKYIHVRGFERFLHGPVGRPIRNSMLGSVEGVVARQLKLREVGLHPEKPLETIARSTVSLVTDGFYEAVRDQQITVRKGEFIKKLLPGKVLLSSGDTLPADIIVCGTGWKQEVPFLEPDVVRRTTDTDGDFRLYRSMLPVGVKNLAFNGYNSSFFSQLNCEVGALWIVNHMLGCSRLPSEQAQNEDIDARLAWMKARTDGKYSKGTNIIPFSMHHIDELLNDMDLNIGRLERLSQWFGPVNPSSYRQLLPRLQKRLGVKQPAERAGRGKLGSVQELWANAERKNGRRDH